LGFFGVCGFFFLRVVLVGVVFGLAGVSYAALCLIMDLVLNRLGFVSAGTIYMWGIGWIPCWVLFWAKTGVTFVCLA